MKSWWLDYESAILRQDPAKASQLAKDIIPQHTDAEGRGQDIRPDDRTRAVEAQFAARETIPRQPGVTAEDLLRQTEAAREALERRQPRPSRTTAAADPHVAEQVLLYELDHAVDVGNRPLRVMVLFSGGGSVEKAVQALYPNNRLEIVAVDVCPKSSATIVTDINEFAQTQLFDWEPGYFDIVWASHRVRNTVTPSPLEKETGTRQISW